MGLETVMGRLFKVDYFFYSAIFTLLIRKVKEALSSLLLTKMELFAC